MWLALILLPLVAPVRGGDSHGRQRGGWLDEDAQVDAATCRSPGAVVEIEGRVSPSDT